MTKILVVNCFLGDKYAVDFDHAIMRSLDGLDTSTTLIRAEDLVTSGEDTDCSHLIISGSETSCLDDQPWTAELERWVQNWVKRKKPVLGICYGHQFMVRALAGIQHVRRAPKPEFGWELIQCDSTCHLFQGIGSLSVMVSHYDEVYNLPNSFRIIATGEGCSIHAFQYMNLPVYGIQFHPEYDATEAEYIFRQVRRNDPAADPWFAGLTPPVSKLKKNRIIFENFVSTIFDTEPM